MINNKELGNLGEDIAYKHLKGNGYTILQRNFRSKLGEIDIVAKDGRYVAFVEVKTRKVIHFGYPREAVDYNKQNRIKNIAMLFLSKNKIRDTSIRFDVVEIILDSKNNIKSLSLIKNAFQ